MRTRVLLTAYALLFLNFLVLSAFGQAVTNPADTGPAGAYNASPLTCTSGGFCRLQTDINGNLKVASGGASGFDSGAVTATGTGGSTSHLAGDSVGGLLSIPVVRTSGGSGIITNFALIDAGGSTNALVVRIWQKNPSSTTCTDDSPFASNATDDLSLIVPPFSVTPSAPAVTTGDAKTYASVAQVTWDYKNASSTTNLYVCLVTVSTQTISGANQSVMLSGPQN